MTIPRTTYVLDTSVIATDVDTIYEFARNPADKVCIADVVLEECDRLKRRTDQTGINVRRFYTKVMCLSGQETGDREGVVERGDLMSGVHLGIKQKGASGVTYRQGGALFLYADYHQQDVKLRFEPDLGKNDISLIKACIAYKAKHPDEEVVFVSGDKNLVTTARANGVTAVHRENPGLDTLYKGHRFVESPEMLARLLSQANKKDHKKRRLSISEIHEEWAHRLLGNEYVLFVDQANAQKIADGKCIDHQLIYRYDPIERALRGIEYDRREIAGTGPLNTEQVLAFDSLLSENIRLTLLLGSAGAGKTYLALLMALHQVIESRRQRLSDAKVYITKRDTPAGGERKGFLPGELDDKVLHEYAGIITNWPHIVMGLGGREYSLGLTFEDALRQKEFVEIVPFGDLRGASFSPHSVVLVEEIQNLEPDNLRLLISRIGKGKIFITGDMRQTDNPDVWDDYNGAKVLLERIIKTRRPEYQQLLSVVSLPHCERSDLASWANTL